MIQDVQGPMLRDREAEQAVSDLYDASYARMVRLAFVLTSDPELAEEIAQEAFAGVWRRWARIRNREAASVYLRRSVVNLANSSLRRRYLHLRSRPQPPTPTASDPVARVDLVGAIRTLAPRQRACVVLRYLEDLSEEATAEALGVSVGTVKSQTHKALRRLREDLGEVWT